MKIPSTFLYDLLQTLTKSEKRYLKVQAGSGEKDYIQLMEAMLSQKVYDEEVLIQVNEKENFVKHIAVHKRYLYELVLKSLANFGQQKLERKVFEKISAANVLIERGLMKAAYSELKKGQKIVEKYELFELQIMLFGIEKKLGTLRQFISKDDEGIQEVYQAEINCLEQLKNTNEYWYLTHRMSRFQMRYQKIQTEEQKEYIEPLIQSPKFQEVSFATNFKSQMFFYQANSIYQFMQGNVHQAYEINKGFLDLLEAKPHFLKLYSERYIATLNNMLIDSFVIGKYDNLEEGIQRLIQMPERPEFKGIKNIDARVFRQRFILLLNWSVGQKDFKRALEWIPEIEAGLKSYGKKIEKHHRITFYYLIAYLFLLNGKANEALKWNNLILNDPKEDVVKEIFNFARILNLLIHYDLDNHNLLESLLLSTPKFLKNRRPIYQTEKSLFRFLSKSMNSIDKREIRKTKNDFKEELEKHFENPKEKRVFNYLDLRYWEPSTL